MYLEATLTFPRFAGKTLLDSGGSYQLYAAIWCIFQTLQGETVKQKKKNQTLCLKSDIKPINLRITKI